ncbi:MAG TPA: L-lactate permease [Actinomycetes bacterium]
MQLLAASFTQRYSPVADNLVLSALVAALPIVVLLGMLGILRVKAHWAALAGLAASLLVAIAVFGMPVGTAAAAAANGAAFGLLPIGWIVLGAIFVYDITVKTGKFQQVRHTIAGLAVDRRIQLLLIAFCFGAFIEGSAGFGTPIAICAAMLIGLGFRPLPAAGLSLIGNTAPVAFGAIGTPIITLASVTGLDIRDLSAMVGRQLPFFSVIIPFWLVVAMVGFRRTREVWPACLTAGLSFAIVQFLVSNLHGPWLVDVVASIVSILAVVVLLRFWQPREIWRFDDDPPVEEELAARRRPGPAGEVSPGPGASARSELPSPTDRRETFMAWLPWILLAVLVFLWGTPQVKSFLNDLSTTIHIGTQINWPGLHLQVVRVPPVVAKPTAEKAVYDLLPLSATGTALLFTGILSGLALRLRPAEIGRIFLGTLYRIRFSLLTIAAMLAIGYTTRYGGLDASMGLALAKTGKLFAFFSPLLGWLGVALTGSDTSSNALFGSLQKITAGQIGISPVLAAASNSSGGVMGKMIDAQSIVVGGVATGQQGQEGNILRYVFFHSVALACLVGLLVLAQAYVFSGVVP